ncbi:hypothetical protein GS482_31715 [Rhodococcus hoagii]|nr:hypothetical protein [Prescottella equi]
MMSTVDATTTPKPPRRPASTPARMAGVEAGRRGGFGVVVGVDRAHHADALREAGADVVVSDLSDLEVRLPTARLDDER